MISLIGNYFQDSFLRLVTTKKSSHFSIDHFINGHHSICITKVRNNSFDSVLVEAGPMPLPLSDGNYLFIYNSARKGYPSKKPNWDMQYNVGWAVLDGKVT
jgi:predicted GH43/DUF377 family glycosyl hydrolase